MICFSGHQLAIHPGFPSKGIAMVSSWEGVGVSELDGTRKALEKLLEKPSP
jgi:hypothetical protein